MSRQRVEAGAAFDVPESDGRVERGRSQDQVGVRVGSSGSGARPFDGVDLLGVGLQIVQAGFAVHAPNLEGHVVRTAGQELALRIPFDCVNLLYKNKFACLKNYFLFTI